MSSMKRIKGEAGSLNVLLVPVVLLTLLFIAAASFAVWAYGSRQDYKNRSDSKVASAVAANKLAVQAADAKQYAEAAKNPLKTYVGPDAYGSIHVAYPKTWSAYVDTTATGTPLNAYFHSDYVPSITSKLTYDLRVQVTATSYDRVMSQFAPLVTRGTVTAAPYSLPKVPSVAGTTLTGAIFPNDPKGSGTMVVLPLRDKTLEIWTESPSYLPDFNSNILPNLTFSP